MLPSQQIEPIASRIPYMVSPGNHEFWFNFSAYKHRFSMPSPPGIQNMYWSASVGPLHLTSMDTEDILDTAWMSKSQAQWLQADLAKAINSTWKIAMGHRPLYCTQHGTQCGVRIHQTAHTAIATLIYSAPYANLNPRLRVLFACSAVL